MKSLFILFTLSIPPVLAAEGQIVPQPYVPIWVYFLILAFALMVGIVYWRYRAVTKLAERLVEFQKQQNENVVQFKEKLEGLKEYLDSLNALRGRVKGIMDRELKVPMVRIEQNLRLLEEKSKDLSEGERGEIVNDLKHHIGTVLEILDNLVRDLSGPEEFTPGDQGQVN